MNKNYKHIDNYFKNYDINKLYDNEKIHIFLSIYKIEKLANFNNIYKVLDIGCGDGVITYNLAKKYPNIYFIGIDSSIENILYAKKNYVLKNLIFFNINIFDILKSDYISNFDFIYSYNVLQYFFHEDIIKLNIKLIDILKKNGSIIHFSIPDVRMKFASLLALNYNNIFKSIYQYFIYRDKCIYENDYISLWHSPKKIYKDLSKWFKVVINTSSDTLWYRFNLILSIK